MLRALSALALLGSVIDAHSLHAQAFLNRTPNMDGTWLPEQRAMQFNFVHRFYVFPGPNRVVVNTPTFTWAFRLPGPLAVGLHYGTRSAQSRRNNEAELFARWRFRESGPGHVGVALTPAWNAAAESFDGELGADWTRGRFTLAAAVRGMSRPYDTNKARAALAGGAVVRLNQYVGLGADVASLVNRQSGEQMAWSVGLLFQIPNSPHYFNFHVSNVDLNTIQGASRRGVLSTAVNKRLYGFEFTIPLHYKRFTPWLKPGTGAPPPRRETTVATEVQMVEFEYRADTVVVGVGQSIRFTNLDPVEHTVTFDGIATSSGLIPKGGTFVLRFDRPGTLPYHCTPHPFMQGVIIVR